MSGGAQDLTLEGMARKLEALTERLGELEIENARLWQKVATLTDSARNGTAALVQKPAIDFKGPVSRRELLGKAGTVAVVATAAGMLLNPREAKAEEYFQESVLISTEASARNFTLIGNLGGPAIITTHYTNHAVKAETKGNGNAGVYGLNSGDGGYGVWGHGKGGTHAGVIGSNDTGPGVRGQTKQDGSSGVYGTHHGSSGNGVLGVGRGNTGHGVLGRNSTGTGVWGESGERGYCGVVGRHTGSYGFGVLGEGKGTGAGVIGRNSAGIGLQGEGGRTGVLGKGVGSGYGVEGEGKGSQYAGVLGQNFDAGGIGVRGQGPANGVLGESTRGYGGEFMGGKAQLRLSPAGTAGRPTTGDHSIGELYMDSNASLFVCTASGTPGTWRRLTTN